MKVMKWIKAKERLPKLDTVVLAYNGKKIFTASRFKHKDGFLFISSICTCCENDECDYREEITHWMPLPNDPKPESPMEN